MVGAETRSDFRKEIRQTRHRYWYHLGIFLIVLLFLLSIYSAGFFLYSAVVVALLLLLSIGIASANLVGIEMFRTLSASEIRLGEAVEARLTVTNKKSLSAFWIFWKDYIDKALDIEGSACHFKTLAPSKSHELRFRLHSTRRGFFRIGPTVMESSGPFGLARRFLVGQQLDFLTVLPRVVPIEKELIQGWRPVHQVPRRMSIFEDPSRFMGVRDYRPGDSLRRIHWKATARSQKIQVKMFEPTVMSGALLAVDMGLPSYPQTGDIENDIDSLLELTITTAASLGEYILAGDQRVGFISNGEDAVDQYPEDWKGGSYRRLEEVVEKSQLDFNSRSFQPVELPAGKGRWQFEQLLAALARLKLSDRISLPELLMAELPRLPRSLVLMVLTPTLDQSLSSVIGSLRRSRIETVVVWIRSAEEHLSSETAVSLNIPVYLVRSDEDIRQLGGQSL